MAKNINVFQQIFFFLHHICFFKKGNDLRAYRTGT